MEANHALALIQAPSLDTDIENVYIETMSCIIDYGWLCDAHRSDPQPGSTKPKFGGLSAWSIFDEASRTSENENFDFVGNCMNSMMNRSGREMSWWYDLGMQS